MKLRNSTLAKYIISYILVLAVAFVGFYAVVRFHLQREYKSVYQTETEDKIQNMTKVLEQNFSDILTMNYIIENNMTFINARYSESSYQRYLAVSELKNLVMTNGLVKDIIYFDIQNSDVLSAGTTLFWKNGTYYMKTISGDLMIPPELIYEKGTENTIYILHAGDTPLYLFPGPKTSSKFRTVYMINDRQLNDLIHLYASQEIDAVGLISQDQIVFATGSDDFSGIPSPAELDRSVFLREEENSALYVQDVGNMQFAIIVRVNTNYFSDYVTEAFAKSYIIMGVFLAIGVLLIFFALKTTYLPLHNLAKRITNKDSFHGNDILALGHAFDAHLSEKETLQTQIGYYKSMVKNAVSPASGTTISDEQIDRLFHENFHGATVVAILNLSVPVESIRWNSYPHPDQWVIITLEVTPTQHTLLMGLPDFTGEQADRLEWFFRCVAKDLSCTVSYSDFSSNPLDIARLYDMAKQAQRYCVGSAVTSYTAIAQFCEENPATYPYQTFDDLAICLRQLHFQQVRQKVSEILAITASYPHVFIRCIYMDILTLINTSMQANSIKYEIYEEPFAEALQLCRSTPTDDIHRTIRSHILSILDLFEQEIISTGLSLPQVTKFVEEHCFLADFSLAFLADHFCVSSVYMSTFFTKRMKTTLTDYVWELRLQRAKYLLETTDESIDRISSMVGYEIPSSFRRKFKQELGISPSEYRRQLR